VKHFLFTLVLLAPGVSLPASTGLSPVGVLVGASFEYCGPEHGCQGPRVGQYLQTLASVSNVALVPYGRPGFTIDDFQETAEFVVDLKDRMKTLHDRLDGSIIGTSGEAIAHPNDVLRKLPSLVSTLQSVSAVVYAIEYPGCEPYNEFVLAHRDEFPDLPLIDPFEWDVFRETYGAIVESMGAVYVRGVYDTWKTMQTNWHIDGPSSWMAALGLWRAVLFEYR